MPARKTNHVKFRLEFVVKLDDRPAFDSVPVGPPDIHKFISAGLETLGITDGYIEGGSRFGMDLHFPRPAASPAPAAKKRAGRKKV